MPLIPESCIKNLLISRVSGSVRVRETFYKVLVKSMFHSMTGADFSRDFPIIPAHPRPPRGFGCLLPSCGRKSVSNPIPGVPKTACRQPRRVPGNPGAMEGGRFQELDSCRKGRPPGLDRLDGYEGSGAGTFAPTIFVAGEVRRRNSGTGHLAKPSLPSVFSWGDPSRYLDGYGGGGNRGPGTGEGKGANIQHRTSNTEHRTSNIEHH